MENAYLNLKIMRMQKPRGGADTGNDYEQICTENSNALTALQIFCPSYIQPKAEVVKARSERYEAYLDLP